MHKSPAAMNSARSRGIDAALDAGYRIIKLNAVAIKGLTEPDFVPLVRFGRERESKRASSNSCRSMAASFGRSDRVLTADEMHGHAR